MMIQRLFILLFFLGFAFSAKSNDLISIYDLAPHLSEIKDQEGKRVEIDAFRGHPVIMSLFYSSCPYTCPVLIDALKRLDQSLPVNKRDALRILLVSLDPENDTPEILKQKAMQHRLDLNRWKFMTTSEDSVREIAAVLDIPYRRTGKDFSHAPVLVLLDEEGGIRYREENLSGADLKGKLLEW